MILFIDTHDSLITIALKTKSKLFIKTQESEYSHSIYVMPMIKDLFEENKQNIKDLTQIIVVNGPGSFTGIRIGLTIAKTMAYSLDISIKSISSLTAYLVSNDSNSDYTKLDLERLTKKDIEAIKEQIEINYLKDNPEEPGEKKIQGKLILENPNFIDS